MMESCKMERKRRASWKRTWQVGTGTMAPQQKKGAELKKSNSTIKMQGEAEVAQLVEQTIRNWLVLS